ncbi:MAG: helix-turn-helix transcriptional regulator [Pseudomonadota bacterium]
MSGVSGIDRYIGQRVRWARRDRRMIQEKAADAVGISLADYQFGETGERRFTSEELVKLARLFEIDVKTLFPNVLLPKEKIDPRKAHPSADEIHDLIHYFSGVVDPEIRTMLIDCVRDMSSFKS